MSEIVFFKNTAVNLFCNFPGDLLGEDHHKKLQEINEDLSRILERAHVKKNENYNDMVRIDEGKAKKFNEAYWRTDDEDDEEEKNDEDHQEEFPHYQEY